MKRHLIILTAYLCACLSLFAQQRTLKVEKSGHAVTAFSQNKVVDFSH